MMRDERARALIEVLHDRDARPDERDDAATDLCGYPADFVVEALAVVAGSTEEDEVLVATAGESIAQIWIELGAIQPRIMDSLARPARAEVEALLAKRAPHLLP